MPAKTHSNPTKQTMGAASVRRNLFHHNLSRRPASATPPNHSLQDGSNAASGHSSRLLRTASSEALASTLSAGLVDGGEIVVKDKNGAYKLDTPVLPQLQDGDEMEGTEDGRVNGGLGATGIGGEAEISGEDKERIEATLMELMHRNRSRQMSSEPAEILNLVHQSLRNKVAALDEDNWMYEAEEDSRI